MGNRTIAIAFGLVAVATVATGCGDARMRRLSAGISKDSAITIMGGRPERTDAYITGGKLIEALYYAKPGSDSGTTPERELLPVVVQDGQVVAWGRGDWEALASQLHIQLRQ